MGPPAQVQQQAQAVAVVLHAFKQIYSSYPSHDPKIATDIEALESGMSAVATAQEQDGFDFALIRMCAPDRVNAAQEIGPVFVQYPTQYLAENPELTDQNSRGIQRAKALGAVGNIIAYIPTWCAQYAANVQNIQIADAQARQQANQAATNFFLTLGAGYLGYIGTPRYEGVGGALNNAYNAARSVQ
jgi:hypothetical protein